jgi:hypothetical protein
MLIVVIRELLEIEIGQHAPALRPLLHRRNIAAPQPSANREIQARRTMQCVRRPRTSRESPTMDIVK